MIVRYEGPKPTKRILKFADILVKEEGAGILNWALEGLRMLLKDISELGDFRLTDRQSRMVDSLLAESQSIRNFLLNKVEVAPHSELTTQELAAAYVKYCKGMEWKPEANSISSPCMATHGGVLKNDVGLDGGCSTGPSEHRAGLKRTSGKFRKPITPYGKETCLQISRRPLGTRNPAIRRDQSKSIRRTERCFRLRAKLEGRDGRWRNCRNHRRNATPTDR